MFLFRIETFGRQFHLRRERTSAGRLDAQSYFGKLPLRFREDLYVIEIDMRRSLQAHPPHNSIPVALGLVGNAVRVRTYVDVLDAVVYPDGYITLSGMYVAGYIIHVCHTQAIPHTYLLSIDPDSRFDMGTFQE